MTTARTILAIALLLLAAYIVVMNWACVISNTKNRRRGIDRHSSMVPLMSILLTLGAMMVFPHPKAEWMLIVPFLDLSTWSLLWFPFALLFHSPKNER